MKLLSHLLIFVLGIGLSTAAAAPDTPPWQPVGTIYTSRYPGEFWHCHESAV